MMHHYSASLHSISRSQEYTRSYDIRYIAEIRHLGLNTFRVLKDKDSWILDNKIADQFHKWDTQWSKMSEKNRNNAEKEANQNIADESTREAREKLDEIENILKHTLRVDDTINWDALKDKGKFTIPNPMNTLPEKMRQISLPEEPKYKDFPARPDRTVYNPRLTFVDKLIKSKGQKKQLLAERLYEDALNVWQESVRKTEEENLESKKQYEEAISKVNIKREQLKKKYEELEANWLKQKNEFYQDQEIHNRKVDELERKYLSRDTDSILEYCELVLNNSKYPETFPKDFELEYNADGKMLIVEYVLPTPEDFPRLSEVKYIATKRELRESFISDAAAAKMYDTAIYNICLRTLHEIFEADKADAIDFIVFNGWVESINKATGKHTNNCIVSVQAKKSDFMEIALGNVDPKACFKNLKGVGSSKLHGITAIQPLVQVNRNDKRFVSSYDVINKLDEGYNLAAMDWEDFEHLLRELFEKEFSSNGGEVKVTQASRDGGVDAVAFDPDPIRGGKIVIQAKRYTNTVGVAAVRDLYGTVMNEGATKGILVTTADFGPDAYEFAKNKPLSLLNGSNLLFLLEKHGQKARIDLVEAKKINIEKSI